MSKTSFLFLFFLYLDPDTSPRMGAFGAIPFRGTLHLTRQLWYP